MLRPGDLIGPYQLVRHLGSGSFGEVWLADKRDAIYAPQCALKFALKEDVDLDEIRKEAEVWVRASGHPNVLPIIEATIYEGQIVIVSEYASGGSLLDWLKGHGWRAPNVEAAVEMTMGILAGLEHLHGQKIIHRDLKLEMVRLPGGTFTMGSDEYDNEKPKHPVKVAAFAIGKYEVTQAQWQAVMGNNPSHFKGDKLPVEQVSWDEIVQFCQRLGKNYRLPTEAEWEYAARAGSSSKWSFGDDEGQLGEYAWFGGNSGNQTHPVGEKKPNAWGLFDLHGNVWEWCEDDWHDNYNGTPIDGRAWADISSRGSLRVLRGGGWYNFAVGCRSALRDHDAPGNRGGALGFRLVRP